MTDWHPPAQPQQPAQAAPYTGAPAYPYGPQLRVPSDLAVGVVVLASVFALVQVAIAVAAWPAAESYRQAARDGVSPVDVFTVYDALGVLLVPTMLAAYVVTCLWLYRCRTNIGTFAPQVPQARSAVWAWLGWWVPVVSFWFPYQLVRDQHLARPGVTPAPRLGLWWTAWIVYLVVERASSRLVSANEPITEGVAGTLPVLETICAVALLVALARWIPIVRRVTADQDLLHPVR